MKNNWHRIGIAFLVLAIMVLGYGGWCSSSDDDDDDDDSGSSVTVTAPSSITATITSASNIVVTWVDNSDNETNFCLYVKAYNASSWSLFSNAIPASSTSYSFPSSDLASSSGNFQLCLTAYDSDDTVESETSNVVSISW